MLQHQKDGQCNQKINPLFLKGKSDTEIVTILHPLANKLKHFGYRHFTQEFIDNLKIELHLIVQESYQNGVLVSIRSTRFKTRMVKRIKKRKWRMKQY